jgi:hypothetical protein
MKIIKEKPKWSPTPLLGWPATLARPARPAWPMTGSHPASRLLTSVTHKLERQRHKRGGRRWSSRTTSRPAKPRAPAWPASQADLIDRVKLWVETPGMACRRAWWLGRARGDAAHRRWPRDPILDPQRASLHYPSPSASTSMRSGWPKSIGHGERPCGRTLVRYCSGRNGNAVPPLLGLLRGGDEGVEGFRVEPFVGFGMRWCGGERAWPWRNSRWRLLAGEGTEGGGRGMEWENTDRTPFSHFHSHASAMSWRPTRTRAAMRHSTSNAYWPWRCLNAWIGVR